MSYTVLIPARLASTRLPNKPLADIAGVPMIVHVARQLDTLRAHGVNVVVAADASAILEACSHHAVDCIQTRVTHPSGTDRLAEACDILKLPDESIVVNVQGDEPLIDASLVERVAEILIQKPAMPMATAAHPISNPSDFQNPNVVKVVLNSVGNAMYFSRACIPWWRDGYAQGVKELSQAVEPLRHIGIYAYRAGFLRRYAQMPQSPIEQVEALEQLRVLWNGHPIAVHIASTAPGPGVDTPEDLQRVRQIIEGTKAQ